MTSRNESIIQKIKGLLAIANDHKNDEECQTAFVMAQKLMMKYEISSSEILDQESSETVSKGQVTAHKTLFWWERQLANIIADNFRVTWYYNSKTVEGESKKKRAIIFLGYENDIALAKEMYILAYEVLSFYVSQFVDEYYKVNLLQRERSLTTELKNSYIRGFLNGLNEKFEKQVKEMEQEYGLMVLLPTEVKQAYHEMFEGKNGLSFKLPPIEEVEAYQKGFHDGNKVDYTKTTLDEGSIV